MDIKYAHDLTGTGRNTKPFDLMPSSDYDLVLDTADTDGVCQGDTDETLSQWGIEDSDIDGTTGNCISSWRIGQTGIACVQIEGSFTRNMIATEVCDFTIDYSDHVISIQMGKVGEADPSAY